MLKVIIQPLPEVPGTYPTYFVKSRRNVQIGTAGELILVSQGSADNPQEFRIYAPGTWKEVNVVPVDGE